MVRGGSRAAAPGDPAAHANKAAEFLRAARDSFVLGNYTAATGNAIHAGISATDAIAGAKLGAVWRGGHEQAADHVERARPEGPGAARQLRRLLGLKTRAEYDPTPIPRATAEKAVRAAERIVAVATRITGDRN